MTLYELTGEYLALMEMAEDEDTDPQTLADTMDAINADIEDKADAYANIIKSLEGEIATLKKEADRLNTKRIMIENHIESMKRNLEQSMIATGKTKFKTNKFSFNIQKNPPSVTIADEKAVPEKFLIKQDPKVDRKGIIDYLKENGDTSWAQLKQGESLRIR